MTNYKSAAYTVGTFWAAKAVMHYRDPRRRSWFEDSVSPDDAPFHTDVPAFSTHSPLVQLMIREQELPSAVRMIQSVTRGPDTVRSGDWVLVQQDHTNMVGQVKSMLQALIDQDGQVARVVRLLVAHAAQPSAGSYNVMWSAIAPEYSACLVSLECVHVTVVRSTVVDERRKYIC